MSRVRKKIVISWIGEVAFIATLLQEQYAAAQVIALAFFAYRRYSNPKLAPPPASTRPLGIAVALVLFVALAAVLVPLNFPRIVFQTCLFAVYFATGVGLILLVAVDIQRFVKDAICIVLPPESSLRCLLQECDLLDGVDKGDTIELWLPRGSIVNRVVNDRNDLSS